MNEETLDCGDVQCGECMRCGQRRHKLLIIMLEDYITSEGIYDYGIGVGKVCENCRQTTDQSSPDETIKHKDWCEYVFAKNWLESLKK